MNIDKVLYTNTTHPGEYRLEGGHSMQFVCKSGLHDYFDFPRNTESIQICISSEPTEDSYKVRDDECNWVYIGRGGNPTLIRWAKGILRQVGFPCYVSLKY